MTLCTFFVLSAMYAADQKALPGQTRYVELASARNYTFKNDSSDGIQIDLHLQIAELPANQTTVSFDAVLDKRVFGDWYIATVHGFKGSDEDEVDELISFDQAKSKTNHRVQFTLLDAKPGEVYVAHFLLKPRIRDSNQQVVKRAELLDLLRKDEKVFRIGVSKRATN